MATGDTTSIEVPPCGPCTSYRPGHQTHWIMWKRYFESPAIPATIESIQGSAVRLRVNGQIRTWQHHEPERLRAAAAQPEVTVLVVEACTAILVASARSTYWFYASPGDMTPCSKPTPASVVDVSLQA